MAKKATAKQKKKEKSIETILWEAANNLRGGVDAQDYKHVVLGLFFLKFSGDKFEEQRKRLVRDGYEEYIDRKEAYTKDNVFYLEEVSRWSYLMERKGSEGSGLPVLIDTALHEIEKANPVLAGALPNNFYSRTVPEASTLNALLDVINQIDTQGDGGQDLIGRVYEYFLRKFAISEGKGKGEFYTPKSIVCLIAEMIEPYRGIIYDPSCGSGGMFVQSIKFIESHNGNKREVSVYGQEYSPTTFKLAKMNLAIRGIAANLGSKAADTFREDQHPDLKADFVMANPPFNLGKWREEKELTTDPRWAGYTVPPVSNANYAWILNVVSKLGENGVAGFILSNGALSAGGDEQAIRKQLIENDLVEAIVVLPRKMFYSTDISVTLWILNRNKRAGSKQTDQGERKLRDRRGELLFLDLRQMGEPFEKKYIQLSEAELRKVADTYHTWQSEGVGYENQPEYCYAATREEIASKEYALVPSRYIEFLHREEAVDFEAQMEQLSRELAHLMAEEQKASEEVRALFKHFGFELKS